MERSTVALERSSTSTVPSADCLIDAAVDSSATAVRHSATALADEQPRKMFFSLSSCVSSMKLSGASLDTGTTNEVSCYDEDEELRTEEQMDRSRRDGRPEESGREDRLQTIDLMDRSDVHVDRPRGRMTDSREMTERSTWWTVLISMADRPRGRMTVLWEMIKRSTVMRKTVERLRGRKLAIQNSFRRSTPWTVPRTAVDHPLPSQRWRTWDVVSVRNVQMYALPIMLPMWRGGVVNYEKRLSLVPVRFPSSPLPRSSVAVRQPATAAPSSRQDVAVDHRLPPLSFCRQAREPRRGSGKSSSLSDSKFFVIEVVVEG
ncbi:unnamed protein product [Cuscuta campestris]|uniref:Uncharacterized protein n=1 Tax=Cuscuta campestris TaxID=132261 RepID=A0A484L173_9ASTE|nr:unnamed protein product [Cuscuta campestris]